MRSSPARNRVNHLILDPLEHRQFLKQSGHFDFLRGYRYLMLAYPATPRVAARLGERQG